MVSRCKFLTESFCQHFSWTDTNNDVSRGAMSVQFASFRHSVLTELQVQQQEVDTAYCTSGFFCFPQYSVNTAYASLKGEVVVWCYVAIQVSITSSQASLGRDLRH